MATKTKKHATSGRPRKAPEQRPTAPQTRRKMPVWLRNLLIGLIIFTIGLGMGILFQFVVCALALGFAVYQLWYRRARWLWTWACFLAVALYLIGVYLAFRYEPAWFLYFGAWLFVIVAVVGEGSRAVRALRGASAG